MNEKKSTIKELTSAFKSENDADVLKRIMLVLHVECVGMTQTVVAEHLCMARSWGVKWYGRYLLEGLPGLRTRPRSGRAPVCFQEGHEEGMENPEEDHLLDGRGDARPDQGDGRGGVPDPARARPAAQTPLI